MWKLKENEIESSSNNTKWMYSQQARYSIFIMKPHDLIFETVE